MTIKVYKDRIEFDDYVLRATPTGFSFNGEIQSKTFQQLFQGTIAGFTSGGTQSGPAFPALTISNVIDKFPFSADSNATDVGDLSTTKTGAAGQSSITNGYASNGSDLSAHYRTIDRFPFATLGNSVNVGNMTAEKQLGSGHSSATHGYVTGGTWPGPNTDYSVIDRFPFAVDENSASVGDLLFTILGTASQSSSTHGYTSGGGQNFPASVAGFRTIQKFPFAVPITPSSYVGDLSANTRVAIGQSSTTHGYVSGGFVPGTPLFYDSINKFPFATDTNSSAVATLTQARRQGAGQSSVTHGYVSGGEVNVPATTSVNTIDKFTFATDANATDVGDLSAIRRGGTGQQH
jgi:hypothetical protein